MMKIDGATLPNFAARDLLGGQALEVDADTGKCRIRYLPGPNLTNPAGTVLGGYLTAMIDDAAGLATWFGGGKKLFATAQMSASFLRAAKPGEAIIAEAILTASGARQAFVEVKLLRERDGKMVASGTLFQTFIGDSA
jgi:uncharacterized protein (TIGR00369 family)